MSVESVYILRRTRVYVQEKHARTNARCTADVSELVQYARIYYSKPGLQ